MDNTTHADSTTKNPLTRVHRVAVPYFSIYTFYRKHKKEPMMEKNDKYNFFLPARLTNSNHGHECNKKSEKKSFLLSQMDIVSALLVGDGFPKYIMKYSALFVFCLKLQNEVVPTETREII